MTMSVSPRRVSAALVWLALLAVGCGDNQPQASYVFRPGSAKVAVNTPALRAQKAAAGIANCPPSDAHTLAGADSLPDVTLPCLGGGRDVHLAGLSGIPSVVNFWAQTCGPCRDESPLLQQFHQAAGARVRVIGIDWQDPQPDRAIAFAQELGLTYPQIADPDAATREPMHIGGLPLTAFVDASGTIVHAKYGPVTSVDQLAGLVSDYLGVHVRVAGGR